MAGNNPEFGRVAGKYLLLVPAPELDISGWIRASMPAR